MSDWTKAIVGEADAAFERLLDQITKAGPGTLASGAQLSTQDVWTLMNGFHVRRLEFAELSEAYDELKETIDKIY